MNKIKNVANIDNIEDFQSELPTLEILQASIQELTTISLMYLKNSAMRNARNTIIENFLNNNYRMTKG